MVTLGEWSQTSRANEVEIDQDATHLEPGQPITNPLGGASGPPHQRRTIDGYVRGDGQHEGEALAAWAEASCVH